MKTWKYNFLNVEDAVEITKYNLTPQEISETLTSGVVLVGVEEVSVKGTVFCYVIEYKDEDEEECMANGFVCALTNKMAKDIVLEAYTSYTSYLVSSIDVFEDKDITNGVDMAIYNVEELASN